MINLNDNINTNRFSVSFDGEEMLAISRALYWYNDRLSNTERDNGRDDSEWDVVMFLRKQISDLIKQDAKLD
jgi:hypothetical protein